MARIPRPLACLPVWQENRNEMNNAKSWLDTLPGELESLDESGLIQPPQECGEQEMVVGVVEDKTKKLYSLAMSLKKTGMQMAVALQFESDQASQRYM